jgi:hypothetical protein
MRGWCLFNEQFAVNADQQGRLTIVTPVTAGLRFRIVESTLPAGPTHRQ